MSRPGKKLATNPEHTPAQPQIQARGLYLISGKRLVYPNMPSGGERLDGLGGQYAGGETHGRTLVMLTTIDVLSPSPALTPTVHENKRGIRGPFVPAGLQPR